MRSVSRTSLWQSLESEIRGLIAASTVGSVGALASGGDDQHPDAQDVASRWMTHLMYVDLRRKPPGGLQAPSRVSIARLPSMSPSDDNCRRLLTLVKNPG